MDSPFKIIINAYKNMPKVKDSVFNVPKELIYLSLMIFKESPFNRILRAIIEVGFIVFLFYSNLLMGEFTKSNGMSGKSLLWALNDIFTPLNFEIAIISGIAGHIVFGFLRKRF